MENNKMKSSDLEKTSGGVDLYGVREIKKFRGDAVWQPGDTIESVAKAIAQRFNIYDDEIYINMIKEELIRAGKPPAPDEPVFAYEITFAIEHAHNNLFDFKVLY